MLARASRRPLQQLRNILSLAREYTPLAAAEPQETGLSLLRAQQAENRAAVLYAPNDLRFEPTALGALQPGSVRIKMRNVGICASDVHYHRQGRIGHMVVEQPTCMGHEGSGVVVEVGSEVTQLAEGDRVAMEPGIPCWANTVCRQGRYNLCPDLAFAATPPTTTGFLSDFVDHDASFCFKLPDNVSHEQGALVEPLSVGIQACKRGQVSVGKRVAILGAGPIGLNIVAAARAFAASRIVVADIRPDTFAVAEQLGASATLLTAGKDPDTAAEAIKALLPPHGPDIVIDCAGYDSIMQTALKAVVRGGTIVLVGLGGQTSTLDIPKVVISELAVLGSWRYANTYPLALELMTSGKLNVLPLISHKFPFTTEGIAAGFDCAYQNRQCIKAMYEMPA